MKAPDLAFVAATTARLAVLLTAGIAPAVAWGHLADRPIATEVVRQCATGVPVPDAIARAADQSGSLERQLWLTVAAAWVVATDAGAPLAPTLHELAGSIRDLAQTQREIAVALASPTATARLVLVLPAIGLICGALLGFDTLRTLFATPAGWVCLVAAGGLLLAAWRWNRRMVRAAQPSAQLPGIQLDLHAIALSGGGSIDSARSSVHRATQRYLDAVLSDERAVDAVLELSQRAGVPAAMLLRTEASEQRREARANAAERAGALAVRLMIPLGLCILPAFMVLTVVPLVLSVLSSTSIA